MRWKNGGGWTTEIAVHPREGEFDWRVSIAEIDADSEFSRLPGIDRSILVLDGEGMQLQVGDDPAVVLRAKGEVLAFSGDRPASCRLLGGPTRDFNRSGLWPASWPESAEVDESGRRTLAVNVMTRRSAFSHRLTTHVLGEPLELERPAGSAWLVHVVSGTASLGESIVEAGDSVLAEPSPTPAPPLVVSGAAELVLVHLHERQRMHER